MGQRVINWSQTRQTPRPDEVGQLLAQRAIAPSSGMPTEASPAMTAGPMAGEPDPMGATEASAWPTASAAALRAAILRGPAKRGEYSNPPSPFARTQLQRLGIPDAEIDALGMSGGANV